MLNCDVHIYVPQNIDTLEKVQKRATKLVHELAKIPYESRLRELRIYSLYCRRQQEDLIETYKLLKGYYDLDWTGFFTLNPVRNTRAIIIKSTDGASQAKQHARTLHINYVSRAMYNTV